MWKFLGPTKIRFSLGEGRLILKKRNNFIISDFFFFFFFFFFFGGGGGGWVRDIRYFFGVGVHVRC